MGGGAVPTHFQVSQPWQVAEDAAGPPSQGPQASLTHKRIKPEEQSQDRQTWETLCVQTTATVSHNLAGGGEGLVFNCKNRKQTNKPQNKTAVKPMKRGVPVAGPSASGRQLQAIG